MNKNEVTQYIKSNGLKDFAPVKSASELAEGVTLAGYSFEQKIGNNTYKYFVRDGKIEKIIENSQKLTGDTFKQLAENQNVLTKIEHIENGTSKHYKDLENISYTLTRQNGDVYSHMYNANGSISKNVTLKPEFKTGVTKAEQDAWLHRNSETDSLVKELIANGRAEKVARDSFSFEASNGDKFSFDKDGEIVEITLKKRPKNGNPTIRKGSDEFDSYLYNHKSAEEEAKKFYESGLASEGATFSISE